MAALLTDAPRLCGAGDEPRDKWCFSGVTDIVLDSSQAYRILRVMGDWRLYRYPIGSNKDLCAEFAGL